MFIDVCVYVSTYTRVCLYVRVSALAYRQFSVYVCARVYVYHSCVCISVRLCALACLCMRVFLSVAINVCGECM